MKLVVKFLSTRLITQILAKLTARIMEIKRPVYLKICYLNSENISHRIYCEQATFEQEYHLYQIIKHLC